MDKILSIAIFGQKDQVEVISEKIAWKFISSDSCFVYTGLPGIPWYEFHGGSFV
jgi:hypothetical protein